VDLGLRYSLYPPITDANNLLTNFSPKAYVAANAPRFANATGSLITLGTGDPLNGIIVAGRNSPYGDAIYAFDKGDIQPRLGLTWSPGNDPRTIVRSAYGVYYDQALVGIFEQNAFTNPPFVNTVNLLNTRLSNPGSGTSSTTSGVRNLIAIGDDFKTPRTQQWNVGVQRQVYTRGVVDVSYVGSHGDQLIRPIDINYPQPADVLRVGSASVNLVRPYAGYGSITVRETTARANYWGLLSSFRHDAGAAGSLTLNYTLSRNRTDSTNDRDAVDIPQNPLDLAGRVRGRAHGSAAHLHRQLRLRAAVPEELEQRRRQGDPRGLAVRRASRRSTRDSRCRAFRRARTAFSAVGGRTSSAIPARASRRRTCTGSTPTPTRRQRTAPTATRCDPSSASQGRNQTDLALSKNWAFNGTQRIQFRAELINAFNHTQWQADPNVNGLDNTCTVSLTDVQPVDRHVRPDPEHARAARDSARTEVLLVRRLPEETAETAKTAEKTESSADDADCAD
jgi:hypothetical protein